MARQQRKALADMRAIEEEDARMTMRGGGRASAYGGRMTGAGATPSMGVSQFRGGARGRPRKQRSPSPMEEEDDELEGGFFGAIASAARASAAAARQAAQRAAQQAARQAAQQRAAQQALLTAQQRAAAQAVRFPRPPAPSYPKGTSFDKAGRPIVPKQTVAEKQAASLAKATEKQAASAKNVLQKTAAQQASAARAAQLAKARASAGVGLSRLGTAANIGIPAYMLADYLRQQQQAQSMGDFGYYDDFAGTGQMPADGGVPDGGVPPVDEQYPGGGFEETIPSPEPEQEPIAEEPTREELADQLGLTLAELDVYMRTGNLPVRRGRRGAGVLKITHGGQRHAPTRPRDPKALPSSDKPRVMPVKVKQPLSGRRAERAEIVKQVMRERGVKLGEASRIVKQEGLF